MQVVLLLALRWGQDLPRGADVNPQASILEAEIFGT